MGLNGFNYLTGNELQFTINRQQGWDDGLFSGIGTTFNTPNGWMRTKGRGRFYSSLPKEKRDHNGIEKLPNILKTNGVEAGPESSVKGGQRQGYFE